MAVAATTTRILLTVVCMLALSLNPGFCFYLDSIIKAPTVDDHHTECSIRTPCGYSICHLNKSTGLTDKSCMFLENSCSCPGNSICMKTDYLAPGSSVLTFTSYCRKLPGPGTWIRHSRPKTLDTGKHGPRPSTRFGKALRQDRIRGMQNAIWLTLPKQSTLTSRLLN